MPTPENPPLLSPSAVTAMNGQRPERWVGEKGHSAEGTAAEAETSAAAQARDRYDPDRCCQEANCATALHFICVHFNLFNIAQTE